MIKFKLLIHKPSETVVTYEKWLELLEKDESNILFSNKIEVPDSSSPNGVSFKTWRFIYRDAKELLFSDDFEVIYESDFTDGELEELAKIYYGGNLSRDLYEKIANKLFESRYYNEKYNLK